MRALAAPSRRSAHVAQSHAAQEKFDVQRAKCYLEDDRQRLLGVIETGFGDLDIFNHLIRVTFGRPHEEHLHDAHPHQHDHHHHLHVPRWWGTHQKRSSNSSNTPNIGGFVDRIRRSAATCISTARTSISSMRRTSITMAAKVPADRNADASRATASSCHPSSCHPSSCHPSSCHSSGVESDADCASQLPSPSHGGGRSSLVGSGGGLEPSGGLADGLTAEGQDCGSTPPSRRVTIGGVKADEAPPSRALSLLPWGRRKAASLASGGGRSKAASEAGVSMKSCMRGDTAGDTGGTAGGSGSGASGAGWTTARQATAVVSAFQEVNEGSWGPVRSPASVKRGSPGSSAEDVREAQDLVQRPMMISDNV